MNSTKNNLKHWLGNENGATSVLVIFMMIVLVTLGTFAITSANVNIKFSKNAISWNAMYYQMDGVAEEYAANVDAVLAKAEQEAVLYMKQKGYTHARYEGISSTLQNRVFGLYKTQPNKSVLPVLLNYIYMEKALQALTTLNEGYPGSELITEINSDLLLGMTTTYNIPSKTNENVFLSVAFAVQPLIYEIEILPNQEVTGKKIEPKQRFVVESWREWQKPNDYSQNGETLWDGIPKQ